MLLAIKQMKDLEVLDLESNDIDECIISSVVGLFTSLRELDLGGNSMNGSEVVSLLQGLGDSLEYFSLSGCDLEDEGIAALGIFLPRCSKLQHLDIGCCNMSSYDVEALDVALINSGDLREMDASGNALGCDGVCSLVKSLVMCLDLDKRLWHYICDICCFLTVGRVRRV